MLQSGLGESIEFCALRITGEAFETLIVGSAGGGIARRGTERGIVAGCRICGEGFVGVAVGNVG